ncbi:hypothetical protein EV127DRAFT_438992 [Xylaria flabelliformis]|nr:hypothetical protein EV127DRAFT_438992 [Xylaria flabelliformis]
MADPLSVAGVVLGVVSLGLQVSSGLSDYLDAVRGRTEELNSVKQQAAEMKDLLLTIKDLFPQLENDWPAPTTLIKRHVKSCDTEISALYALLSELSQTASSSSGIRLKLAEQKKKLIYPFNRSHVSRLEKRLTKVNGALQMALQVTELNISITSANQIRQVHDLVLSISQLQVMQTQSASLTTARAIPPEIASRGAVLPLDSMKAAISLASEPPSLLSSSIEVLQNCSPIQAARNNLFRICSCRQSRKTSFSGRSWGYFSFSCATSSTRRHLPDCPFSQIDVESQATMFTVEYKGLRNLFRTAIALSLLNTRGAGGRSISPNFTYYPSVDERNAPVFRIMKLATPMAFRQDISEAVKKTLQYCFNSIFILYSRKKASPKDIDSYGQSLMHSVADFASEILQNLSIDGPGADMMLSIVENLAACGVPVTTYDRFGCTPSAFLMHGNRGSDLLRRLLNILLPVDPDLPLCRKSLLTYYDSNLLWLLRDSRLAEASGCGPLSLAARAGDERLVMDLLKRDPQTLKELNQFRHTPLHLAINHPRCLHLILEADGSMMLENRDLSERTPLESASNLGYSTSVQILLASGSRIPTRCICDIDESCIDDLLAALKQRRNELKDIAIENLTKLEAESFALYENKVLDGNAYEVQELLLKKGIYVPPQLSVDRDIVYALSTQQTRMTKLFDKLWALGFRDVNSCGSDGLTPLLSHCDAIQAMQWLIERGADYWTPLSEKSNGRKSSEPVTPAHFCLGRIGEDLYINDHCTDLYNEKRKWIFEKLMQVRVSDTCFSCPCFVGGCTPFKALFDWCRCNTFPSSRNLAQWWMSSTRIFQTSLNEEDFTAALRRITFDALGISHTCCNFLSWNYWKSLLTPEEADEVNSEQEVLLTSFTNLLTEFSRIANEDRGGAPLIVNDPEEFWMHRWLPRITETLEGLDGNNLTEEERSAAEAIGVVWGPQLAQVVETEIGPAYRSPEYVMREVEKIMNE